MGCKHRQLLVAGVFAVGILLTLISRGGFGRAAGIVLLIAGVVLEVCLFRCPHCGAFLGRHFSAGKHCIECGEKIE